jgi:hypothetical protein
MVSKPIFQLVSGMTAPDKETTEKFYKWLEEVHCPDLFRYKGIKRYLNCRRIPGIEPIQPMVTDYPEYISINEFFNRKVMDDWQKSLEVKEASKDGLESWGEIIGRKKVWLAAYEEVKTWERKLERKGNRVIQLVAGAPPADPKTAERYYQWLDEVRTPMVFNEFDFIVKATNYRRVEAELPFEPEVKDYPYYLTIFEINSLQDLKNQMAAIKGRPPVSEEWGTEVGYKKIWQVSYEIVKAWER